MTDRAFKIHQNEVEELYERLSFKNYNFLGANIEYDCEREHGELDIATERNGFVTYYEVKSHHSEKARHRAISQLHRWASAHCDRLNCRMVYVARNKDGSIHAERVR